MTENSIASAVSILRVTPFTLRELLGSLPQQLTASSGDRGDWAPHDVVAHLIHAELTDWVPRAEVILAQGIDRRFPPFDRDGQFAMPARSLGELLDELVEVRRHNLDKLAGWELDDEKLGLRGVHPEFGEVTLGQLIATWAVHDLTHLRQIANHIARRFNDDVGPWRAYLSILK